MPNLVIVTEETKKRKTKETKISEAFKKLPLRFKKDEDTVVVMQCKVLFYFMHAILIDN